MKKTIVRALTVMAVTVTAIALFGCKNGLGSTVLAEVIKSEEGSKGPVVSTDGISDDFDGNATVGGVALSNYATDLEYNWVDSIEAVVGSFEPAAHPSGTIKFYGDGYYIPVTLSEDYKLEWGCDKQEGNTYLWKVRPISASWNGIYTCISKNGVMMWILIDCENVTFDTTGDYRPLVTFGVKSGAPSFDPSFFLSSGDSVDIEKSVDEYGNITVDIDGKNLKWLSANEMTEKYGGITDQNGKYFNDGYYLPVTFHENIDDGYGLRSGGLFYSSYYALNENPATEYLLYFSTNEYPDAAGYTSRFFKLGARDIDSDKYLVGVKVSLPEDDSDDPENPENPDIPDVPASSEKTGIIIGDKVYAFADLEDEGISLSTEAWNSDYGIEKLDGTDVLRLSVGSYKSYTITFETALDLSNKKIVVSYKTDAEYEDKSDYSQDKVVLRKDASTASEVDYSFINKTTDWTSNELNVKNAGLSQPEYSESNSIEPLDDATAVKEIVLALQGEAGTVYIRSISIVDAD